MDKQEVFDAIRYLVNTCGVEPHEGFVSNELSVSLFPALEISLEGRSKGKGIAIARYNGEIVAHEFHNILIEGFWTELLNGQVKVNQRLDSHFVRMAA